MGSSPWKVPGIQYKEEYLTLSTQILYFFKPQIICWDLFHNFHITLFTLWLKLEKLVSKYILGNIILSIRHYIMMIY